MVVKTLIGALVLILLNAFNVVRLYDGSGRVYGWKAVLFALLFSLLITVAIYALAVVCAVLSMLTLGLALITLPLVGPIALWVITSLFPSYIEAQWFWPLFLSGLLFTVLHVRMTYERDTPNTTRPASYRP